LNTKNPKIVYLFDKEISFDDYQKIVFPGWFFFEILKDDKDLKKSWLKSFKIATKEDLKKTVDLPNFDYKVFEELTGISKAMIDKRLKENK